GSCAMSLGVVVWFFFFQAEDGIRDDLVTGVQTCALPISSQVARRRGIPVVGFYHSNVPQIIGRRVGGALAEPLIGRYVRCLYERSEERRVGKECRARRSQGDRKKNRRVQHTVQD